MVLAIVVSYNGSKWINKCLNSLTESSLHIKILAIDNNSDDDTVSIIKNNFKLVEIIELKENLGFGKENNIVFRRALELNASYVFLLNQDAWIKNNALGELLTVSKNNLEYAILSPIHLNGIGNQLELKFNDCLNVNNILF